MDEGTAAQLQALANASIDTSSLEYAAQQMTTYAGTAQAYADSTSAAANSAQNAASEAANVATQANNVNQAVDIKYKDLDYM